MYFFVANGNLLNVYTNCFADHFRKVNTYCPLVFKYKNMRKSYSTTPLSPYIHVVATCKFNECCKYHFLLDEIPEAGTHVTIVINREGEFCHKFKPVQKRHMLRNRCHTRSCTLNACAAHANKFCHKCELVKKRHMIGDTRAIINEQLKKTTISDYQITQYTSMSTNNEMGGKLTLPQTKDSLRKLRSEKHQLNYATDLTQETKILMDIFRTIIPGGFIQNFSYNPYKVHLYTIDQLEMFRASQKKIKYYTLTKRLV